MTRAARDRFECLAQLAQLGARSIPPAQLATQALSLTLDAVGAQGGDLCVLAGYARYPLHSYWPDLPAEAERTPAPAPDRKSVERLLAAATAICWSADEAPRALAAAAARLGYAKCASVPIMAGGRTIGVIDCAARSADAFSADSLELLTAIGALLGPMLDLTLGATSAPSAGIDQSALELRALQRVAETVSRSLDLDEVLGRCLDVAAHVAHATAGAIYLRDSRRAIYTLQASLGMPQSAMLATLPIELVDRRFANAPPELIEISDAPDDAIAMEARRLGFNRVVVVPLRVEGRLVGVLGLNFQDPMTFVPSTVMTLEAIAGQEAVAIENARAHRTLELRARLALILREFGKRAVAPLDDKALHGLILETALKISRSDRGLISRVHENMARVVAGWGKDERLVGMEASIDEPYLRMSMAHEEPFVVEDTNDLDPNSLFAQVAAQNQTRSFVLFTMRYHGSPVGQLFAASGEPVRYEGEEIEAMQILSSMAAEVLERARAEADVQAERKRLGDTIEHLPILVAVINNRGELLHLNEAGRQFARLMHPRGYGDWREAMTHVHTYSASGEPIPTEELLIMRAFRGEHPPATELVVTSEKGDLRMTVMAVAAPIQRAPDGTVSTVVTAFQDVSALRELADAKDRFLRVASHELRSPLTGLRATTSLLELDPTAIEDPTRRAVMLQRIKRQVDRLVVLVEQLLDSARLNAAEVPIQRVRADLVEVAREAIAQSAVGVPPGRVELAAESPVVEGDFDPPRIEQVLSNLVANALRYSAPDTPVLVKVSSAEQRVTVEVSDRGIGIPADQIDKVFSPFFRASNAAAQHRGGLGLGLHIAADLVRRHGGKLTVVSTVGEGSTFTVELPRFHP